MSDAELGPYMKDLLCGGINGADLSGGWIYPFELGAPMVPFEFGCS